MYVVQSRTGGKSKRVTVGRHGEIAPDQARKEAARLIARIKAGQPLAENKPETEPAVTDLADRYKVQPHKERFLTPDELARLGRTLDIAPAKRLASRHAVAAIRLLVLTGCRRNEIMGLAWEDLDFQAGEMRLTDSKTGARILPLPPAAAAVLEDLPRISGNPWVFPGKRKGTHQVNINESWNRVRKRAGLDGVRLHDLRHTFASRALAIGEGLPMIGKLLGHRKVQTTARYAHLARDSMKASAARRGKPASGPGGRDVSFGYGAMTALAR